MNKVEALAKDMRIVTLEAKGNGLKISNSSLAERIRINQNYGNGLDWKKEGNDFVLYGLFGVTADILADVEAGRFKL